MKRIFFFLFLLFSINLFSQAEIDSLESKLAIVSDEEKVEILNKLAKAHLMTSPEKAIEYGKQALELSIKTNNEKEEVNALLNIGDIYQSLCNYNEALQYHLKALKIYEIIIDKKGSADCLNDIGIIHRKLGNYDKALEYYLKSLQLRKEIEDKKGIAFSYNNIGLVYWNLSDYDKALTFYMESLKILKEIGDKEYIAASLNNIGIIHEELSNYDKALIFFHESLIKSEEIGNKNLVSISLINIGEIYSRLNNYDKALEYYYKSMEIFDEIGNKNGIAVSLNNIGEINYELNNYDKALEFYLKSLRMGKEIEDKNGIANTLTNIGNLYLKLNNYNKAFIYLEQSLQLSTEIKAKDLIRNSYKAFSDLYSAKANYQKALEYYILYSEVKDSIFTKESSEQIAEMQTKYETEKKEKENEILKKDNEIQKLEINKQQNLRNSFIAISVLVLLLAFVIYARYRSKQKTNIILDQKNTEIENANTELSWKNKQITKQKNQLSGTLKELRETQKMLTDTAHHAGMAEIATGILHNVGNVLNSVKVSSQILIEKIKSSKVNNLSKVLALVEEHSKDIGTYITSDNKGKMLPEYLIKVGTMLKDEQNNSLKELFNLHKGINHIEEIIAVQQSYAGVSGLVEKVALSDMMDDVLKMHSEMFKRHKIKIEKNYSKTTPILSEKGKLIQVFVNLLKNAKESIETKDEDNGVININIIENTKYQAIEITDNGEGISKENLTKIFSYGFSTKKNGKGFGLHTSALTMAELKGKLSVESDGEGKGAKFIVDISINRKKQE